MQKISMGWRASFPTAGTPVRPRTRGRGRGHSVPRAQGLHGRLLGERVFILRSHTFAATGQEPRPGCNGSVESAGGRATPSAKPCGHGRAHPHTCTHTCSSLQIHAHYNVKRSFCLIISFSFQTAHKKSNNSILCFNIFYILPSTSNWLLFIKVYFIN